MTRFARAVSRPLIGLIIAHAFTGVVLAADDAPLAAADLAARNPIAALCRDAEQGNVRAEYILGCCYNGDFGLPQDSIEAVKWWAKAAASGVSDAQYCLGLCYYRGQGVAKDVAAAAKWWRTAADHGQADAQYFLGLVTCAGIGVPKSAALGMYWLHKSADSGDEAAQETLAKIVSPPR